MINKLSLADLDVRGKKVLMRVDFNVPLDKQANITDDTRIAAALPSIRYVLEHGGALILMSHMGRPKDKRVPEMSLAPCAKKLSSLLGQEVLFAQDCIGPSVTEQAKQLKAGQILLLENLRFHRSEEHPDEDPTFAQALAQLGDLYVDDAFGTAHRAHSSTAAITRFFPGKAAAGFLMEKEIEFLGSAVLNPERPFYAIIGGAKISSKLGVIKSLLSRADVLLIGGGMAYTFLKAQGIPIGDSIHEDQFLDEAKEILAASAQGKARLLLPLDIVVAQSLNAEAQTLTVSASEGIPNGFEGVDIGPKTIALFSEEIKKAKTIFWNGPLGVFEIAKFAQGTNSIAKAMAALSTSATTVVGGGDSIAAVQAAGLARQISHLSTGGGASLEYLEFGTLPGIEALSDRP